ncbi:methyltransferase domain-containing protein [Micromonospora sp. NPDC126480]|uniref:class I SAM-dependent methyltransferase n=1 Tax=Micromonospora sp. NPDC126480 TaxID=3155312 RepID=UPI003325A91A
MTDARRERAGSRGCGAVETAPPSQQKYRTARRMSTTDAQPARRERARRSAAIGRHVEVRVGDAQQPDFPEGSFDAVLAGLVVFLLPDPGQALRAYARLLQPAGRLAVSTFAAQDPAFVAALDALAGHLPADRPRPAPAADPFADDVAVTATMAAADLTVTAISEHRVDSRFRDVDHWMEWMWSHGGRALLRHIPADRLEAAATDAARALEPARRPGGGLILTTAVRITVATPHPAAEPQETS